METIQKKETKVVTFPSKEFMDSVQDYNREYLSAGKKFRVIMWHRGSRKTTQFVHRAFTMAIKEKGLYWHIFPYLNEAVETVWIDPQTSIFRWIPPEMMKTLHVNNSAHSITFPNGSVYMLKGADKPDSLRGPKPKHIFVDEYGEIARRHGSTFREAVIEPSIRSSGGGVDYGGTPKGNNDFQTVYQYGKTRKDWWSSKKTIYDTGLFTEEEIEDIKKNMVNPDFFNQEYMVEVMDGVMSVFKKHLQCCEGQLVEPIPGHTYIFGIDLARSFDRTAIVGFDTHTNHMVYFKTLFNEPWERQRMTITSVLGRYNNAQAVVDATGAGDAFVEQLVNKGLPIYSFKINSNQIKRSLIEKLAMYLENKYITYPNIEEIKDELNSFEYELTASSNVIYSAPVGKHDDIVLAMALAVQMLNMTPIPFKEYTIEEQAVNDMQLDDRTGYWK